MSFLRLFRKTALALSLVAGVALAGAGSAAAITVNIPGSFQSELGCAGDWDPACATSQLTYDGGSDRYLGTFLVPAGSWEFKIAIDGGWAENYGAGGVPSGQNISMVLGTAQNVTFTYDHNTKIVKHNGGQTVIAPGNFQSELGCPGDWDPGCLSSVLLDLDGDGVYSFATTALPAGSYESKIALGGSWDVNFGEGGTPGGSNLLWNVPPGGALVTFTWNANSMVPNVTVEAPTNAKSATWGGLKLHYR